MLRIYTTKSGKKVEEIARFSLLLLVVWFALRGSWVDERNIDTANCLRPPRISSSIWGKLSRPYAFIATSGGKCPKLGLHSLKAIMLVNHTACYPNPEYKAKRKPVGSPTSPNSTSQD
eukprot:gene8148-16754_t